MTVHWLLMTVHWLLPGAIAQLGERVLCKHEVVGSIPSGSTIGSVRRSLLTVHLPPRDENLFGQAFLFDRDL